jgi:hypothetical protein
MIPKIDLFLSKIKNMLTREKTIQIVQNLPPEFSMDDLVERLILVSKVEHALEQVENGEVATTEEARKLLAKWLN